MRVFLKEKFLIGYMPSLFLFSIDILGFKGGPMQYVQ